jgi:hypothetical protein
MTRVERNERGWPGMANWRPPTPHVAALPLTHGLTLVLVALPERDVAPERCGLGAAFLVLGEQILAGWLILGTGTDRHAWRRVRRWAARHPLSTAAGTRPWTVVSDQQFNREVIGKYCYRDWIGRPGQAPPFAPIVGADLGRSLALLSEHWWQARRHDARGGWGCGLAGWGMVTRRKDGHQRWVRSYGRPVLYARERGKLGLSTSFGRPRFAPDPEDPEQLVRRGAWNAAPDGTLSHYRGEFVELFGVASGFDARDTADLADHCDAFGLPQAEPHAVTRDAAGAAHVVEVLHAQHRLMLALDEEAAQWQLG